MEKIQLQGFGITLRIPEQHEHEFALLTPRAGAYPEILRLRIAKMPGGQVEGPLRDPYSPIIKFFFSEKELRIEQEGTLHPYLPLSPYTNHVKPNPNILLTIPVDLLKARVYDLSYRTDNRGDFILLTGKFKHGSHVIMINVWALALFDEINEIKMTGEIFFRFKSIGRVAKPENFLPFYWMQIVNEGKEDKVIEDFMNYSHSQSLELVGRVATPTLMVFRHIAWTIERNGRSERDGINDARQAFVELFSI